MPKRQLWFTRRGDIVKGPFPAGMVTNYILLGRLLDSDEVSTDSQTWQYIRDVPELIPEVMKADLNDPMTYERLQAARRWADERDQDRRHEGADIAHERRRSMDRREHATDKYWQKHGGYASSSSAARLGKEKLLIVGAIIALIGAVGRYFYYYPPQPGLANQPNCEAPAAAKVNWTNCAKEGASLNGVDLSSAKLFSIILTGAKLRGSNLSQSDLSYALLSIADLRGADLSGANLLGASLRGADLSLANLQEANLAYANFTGANLSGADLKNAKFDHAVWIDGHKCAPGSVGGCTPAP